MALRVVEVELRANYAAYQAGIQAASQSTSRFGDQIRLTGSAADRAFVSAGRSTQTYTSEVERAATSTRTLGGAISNVAQVATGFTVGAAAVQGLQAGIHFASDAMFGFNSLLQNATIGFTTMLGSGERARNFLADLQHFATITPFDFPGLVRSSQRMLAMGFSAQQIIPTLRAVGDSVAALGGTSDLVDRVTLAMGQLLTRGKVTADNMRQLTEAGIPAWTILADKMHLTTQQVQDLSEKGLIPARKAIDFLTAGMEERFGGLMDKASHTWQGALSNIKDISTQAIGGIFRPFFDGIAHEADRLGSGLTSGGFQSWLQDLEASEAQILPKIGHELAKLGPLFRNVASSAAGVGQVIIGLGKDVAPFVEGIVALGGSAAVGSLTKISGAIAATTGFLADHQQIVLGLAALYAARFVPAIGMAVSEFVALQAEKIAGWAFEAAGGVDALALSLDGANRSATLFAAASRVGIAAVIFTLISDFQAVSQAAKDYRADTEKGLNLNSFQGLDDALRRNEENFGRIQDKLSERLESTGAGIEDLLPWSHTSQKLKSQLDKANELRTTYATMRENLSRNLGDIEHQTGVTGAAATGLATKLGIDLTQSFNTSGPDRQRVVDEFKRIADQAGLTTQEFGKLGDGSTEVATEVAKALSDAASSTGISTAVILRTVGDSADRIKAFSDAITGAMKATAQSWQADADVISTVSKQIASDEAERAEAATTGTDKHTAALADLHKAQTDVQQLQRKSQFDHTAKTADELANAQDRVAKASAKVNEAGKSIPSATQRIESFYKDAIKAASTFSAQINEASSRGLDPHLIARLLEAGPTEAGPVLTTILSDHSGRLIKLANASEKALEGLTAQAVENARIQARAIAAPTDEAASHVQRAMAIAAEKSKEGANASVQAVASALHISVEDVKTTMAEYGIVLKDLPGVAGAAGNGIAAGLDPAQQKLDGLINAAKILHNLIQGLPGEGEPTGHDQFGSSFGPTSPQFSSPPITHATGGVDAHTVTRQTVLYGERSTGGEAFIPRYGSWAKGMETLGVAAGWLGAKVTPMASGGILPVRPVMMAGGGDHALIAEVRALRATIGQHLPLQVSHSTNIGEVRTDDPAAFLAAARHNAAIDALQGI